MYCFFRADRFVFTGLQKPCKAMKYIQNNIRHILQTIMKKFLKTGAAAVPLFNLIVNVSEES